jgi:hypothetical protein
MNRVRLWAAFLGVFLLMALAGYAQSDNANVSGTITDPSGSAIPNAKVTLKNQATGLTREATSNESGAYSIPTIPSGMYTLTVEVSGFKKYESKDNKVDPSVPANISASLSVGALTETVEVTATASLLQTESGTLGKIVESSQIANLQLNGRNAVYLAQLKPGVRGGNTNGFNFGLGTGGFNINGARSQETLITFDGAVGIRTRSNGESIGTADLDNVAEVQILTAGYGAEYGRSSGGQIRVVTKSGTSRFHGSAYEYFRNDVLDANTWSRNRSTSTNFAPINKFNQFGFNVSGPIYIPKTFNTEKSKLFFTYSEEWAKRRQTQTNTRLVPTARMKSGDFGEWLVAPNLWFGSAQIIRDPNTGSPFPGNVIPKERQSPNGMALLNVYPLPNISLPNANWQGVASAPTDQRKDSFGVDYLPGSKDNIRFRASLFHFLDVSPFQTTYLFSSRTFDRPNQSSSLNWTHTFTPTLIMETTLAASRDQVFIRMTDTPAFDRTTYGLNYPYIFPGKDRPNKLPAIALSPFNDYSGSPYPSNSTGPIYTLSTNLTKIINNHTLKFGFAFERSGQNDYDQINVQGVPGGTDNQNGRFEFTTSRPGGTGVAAGDAALGLFTSYAEIGIRSFTPYRGHMYEGFVQDEWKASPKLKVTYGVRYSIIQPYYSLWGNMSIFDPKYYDPAKAVRVDPATGNPIAGSGDAYNGVVIPGNGWPDSAKGRVPIATTGEFDRLFRGGAEPRYYSNIDYGNFQPRLGIAYQLNDKTVVRTGAGKYTTKLGVSDSVFLGGNPPLQPIASVPTGNVDNPGGGSRASFPLSISTQAKEFHMPQSYNWNFTVEREIGFSTVLSGSYVGRRGIYGQREKNINQPAIGAVQANPGVNVNALRPYKGFGPIRETYNDANSTYNALQLELSRRFKNGLSYGVAYTYSKCMDSGSNQRDVIPDAYDASFLWGPCDYDVRNMLLINGIYELPIFRNSSSKVTKALLGGWQVTGIVQFQTGQPFKIQTADDFAGIGPGSGNQIQYFWKYAKFGQDPDYPKQFAAGGNSDPAQYLTVKDGNGTSLFTAPATGTIVKDRIRNYFYNPSFNNLNVGLFKTFRISESHRVLFRAEGFDVLNHPNWNGVDGNPRSGTFGKVTSKNDDRRNIQLSLRYSF